MAKPLLDDELWEAIEPLLPPPKPRRKRYPGCKPLNNRRALTGILFLLKHGSGLGVCRWVAERTLAWLHQYRRLRIRWERLPEVHEAFLTISCAPIWRSRRPPPRRR